MTIKIDEFLTKNPTIKVICLKRDREKQLHH